MPRFSYLAPALGVLVVIAVAAVFIAAHGSGGSAGPQSAAPVKVAFVAQPTQQAPVVTSAALSRTVEIMRQRLGLVFHDFQITSSGRTVVVLVRHAPAGARARIVALAAPAQLAFYDWEANALTPNGKTVASQLQAQDPAAIAISQGSGSAAPGNPGAGSLPLYQAVKLAAKQPAHVSADNSRLGSQYYAFGPPGSAACAAAARARGSAPAPGVHCLLAGPEDNRHDLLASLKPLGLSISQGQETEFVIPPGTVVIQAADSKPGDQTPFDDPHAQFYVLKDHVALSGNAITNPRQSTDAGGEPDVTFGFDSTGARAFQRVTARVARRGEQVSAVGAVFNQHFAVALDDKLITVPQIDFKTYPNGISGTDGADLVSGFTTHSAQDLATRLRLGALPVALKPTY